MHILLPTDGSPVALAATKQGLALLAPATKVTLLCVIGDLPADTGGGIEGPVYTPEQEEELRKTESDHATKSLAEAAALVEALPSPPTIDRKIETGDPAAVICLAARELGVDAIVVGSHGKGFLSRVLLGSASEYVTRHAPCPVLVVRVPHDDEASS